MSETLVVYHGTTASGVTAMQNGLPKPQSPWNCADSDKMYFAIDVEDKSGFEAALFQARLQTCMDGSEEAIVIQCTIPKELLSEDMSVEHDKEQFLQMDRDKFNWGYVDCASVRPINIFLKSKVVMGAYENGNFNHEKLQPDLKSWCEEVLRCAGKEKPDPVDFFNTWKSGD